MIRTICNTIFMTILIGMTLMALALVGPYILGYRTYAVLSGSMEPDLQPGSMAYVRPSMPDDVIPGDIITYSIAGDNDKLVTHRVVSIDEKRKEFITKGDANDLVDGPIAFDRLIGRMLFSIPYLGYIVVHMRTRQGILLAGVVLGTMVLLSVIPELLKGEGKGETRG